MKGIYIVGGYPNRDKFKTAFTAVADSGFDFIEIGIPFNDPIADGPIIAKAANQAIDNGITTDDILNDIIEFKDLKIKKYIMTYSNIIYSYGTEKFSKKIKDHIDGIIIADLPNRLADLFYSNGLEIPVVPFATLETRESDIKKMNDSKSEFIYFVGIRGITGSVANFTSKELLDKINLIKKLSNKKIIIGFGIKTAQDVKQAMNISEGFVIGTEAVKRQDDINSFSIYLKKILS